MLPTEIVGYTGDGGKDLQDLGLKKTCFLYAKPVKLVSYLLEIAAKPDATVLDFFAGSGTTGEAVMKLNKAEGGSRRFILFNSNENDICRSVTVPRVQAAAEKLGCGGIKHVVIDLQNAA